MRNGQQPSVASPALTAEAVRVADAAAHACGVKIRLITGLSEIEAVHRLFADIWRPALEGSLMSIDLLQALSTSGNYVVGAHDGAQLLGACVGLFGAPAEKRMHSHIAGVLPAGRRRGIGFALKLHQRAWALQCDISTIAWTFDPLISRNAFFNLAKLGAQVDAYRPNFYGRVNDGVNAGGDTDRLLVNWQLDTRPVAKACAGTATVQDAETERARGAAVALGRSASGRPIAGSADAATVLVAVPPDIERLRACDPAAAQEWRDALREALETLLAEGAIVAGFDRSGWYVLTRPAVPTVAGPTTEPRNHPATEDTP
jgi:predicted GNAT superfamily acetyltransferase